MDFMTVTIALIVLRGEDEHVGFESFVVMLAAFASFHVCGCSMLCIHVLLCIFYEKESIKVGFAIYLILLCKPCDWTNREWRPCQSSHLVAPS
jgi:hypothetical protein